MDARLDSARRADDRELTARLETLASRAREATAALVAHLAELEARDLHLTHGYASPFVYCREALLLSEHDAYRVVAAARVVRRHPIALAMLAKGTVNLTTLKLLAPCLTPENHREVLALAAGKRRVQVEEIVAALTPRPDAPAAIERLLSPGARPSAADRYTVKLTVDRETVEKLRLAKDMLRHALPAGDDATLVSRALSALLVDLAKARFAATERPSPARAGGERSRYVPADVRREVWLRDMGRCAFRATSGHRCGERGFLEFHHVRPYAAEGGATVANIELRCRRHNAYEARVHFE